MDTNDIVLGMRYRDVITGFSGIAIGVVNYITGCNQVLLSPSAKDGAWVESQWMDVSRLEQEGNSMLNLPQAPRAATPGFAKAAPKK